MTAVAERDCFIDIDERIEIVGYGRSMTYERVKAGKVKRYNIGRRALYSKNEAHEEVAAIKAAKAAGERQSEA